MRTLLIALSLVALAGCTSTQFKQFESRDAVRIGQGGTKDILNGMDIWSNGDPPRKYKILGVIEDERNSGGFSKPMRNSAVVAKAKEIGGDALIEGAVNTEITGSFSNSFSNGFATANTFGRTTNAFGSGFSVPVGKMNSKYTVIKYLE
jgi:hypothetical protein